MNGPIVLVRKRKEQHLKKRMLYAGLVLMIAFLGICSRKFFAFLPNFIALHAGDTLWSAMVYLSVRIGFMSKSSNVALLLSILFSYSIEFSQLYQADWIKELRQTQLGALVLGHGFLLLDLIRYACGILATYLIEKYVSTLNLRS